MKSAMKSTNRFLGFSCAVLALLSLGGCNRDLLSGSKLTSANYDQITLGMSKTQVEAILGAPRTIDSKDLVPFKKTTFRYENGRNFAIIAFKNDEVDSKDTNLGREP
jgi:outer membrane protein assembly factor BamE (lipoprotein component of BamABCDE complex)